MRLTFSELNKNQKLQAVTMANALDIDDQTTQTYALDANGNVVGCQPKEALQIGRDKDPVGTKIEKELMSDLVPLDAVDPTPPQELSLGPQHEDRMERLAEAVPAHAAQRLAATAKEAATEPDPVAART